MIKLKESDESPTLFAQNMPFSLTFILKYSIMTRYEIHLKGQTK